MTRRAMFALLLVLALAISGCAGGRNSLGTGASACFRALPVARTAVHNKGRLVGVRRVSAASFRARLPSNTAVATLPNEDLCVFAFSGTYDPGSVLGAHNTMPGHFAVIAVASKHPGPVASFVLNRLPTRFQHLH